MFFTTNVSDLLVDLSTEKQQFLAGGCKYSTEQPTQGTSAETTMPEMPSQEAPTEMTYPTQPSARLVVGNIITVTPFAKCLPGQSCFGGAGSQGQY